ncbi:NTP transferase domain-containing protein [Candidatus Roizmanbacteria bacterium]|nr:NTP transferase domain-containing protein [Candidatus Roizmanbacteria bacterium]
MNIVVFAGGVGTRLWPLSRKKSPKQFEQIIDDKSTLQLAVERLLPAFDAEHIYVSTNKEYTATVADQLSMIPRKNIIGEPEMRDVGPAVGLATAILAKVDPDSPMAIIWSDHLVKQEELFRKIFSISQRLIEQHPNKIVFIAQKPRFASQNLGWIQYGPVVETLDGIDFHKFEDFKYRPDPETAQNYLRSGDHAWNLGYFVTTPGYLFSKYKEFVPDMYDKLKKIQSSWGTKKWEETVDTIYPTLAKMHFDNAILERLSKDEAYVVSEDLEWSDVGAWEALKEALQKTTTDNVTRGNVILQECRDTLAYNYNDKQLLIAIDAEELLIVNTNDVVLVCRKDSVPKIKKLVEGFAGTEHEHLT